MIPNSFIFYLVNNNVIHLKRLYDSLDCLNKNFLSTYPYTVVFGHEGLSEDTINEIKKHIHTPHHFYKLEFKIPNYTQHIVNQIPEKFKGHWDENAFFSMGYRHMCRFFAGEIFKDSFFDNVNYLLRIDCDSYFTGKIEKDIFKVMQDTKSVYASVGEDTDMDYVVEGLHDFCDNHFNVKRNDIRYNGMYQTHFELVDFKWFKMREYLDFYNKIDETGNIYIKRWGDAPIKYQGVNRLLSKDQIHMFELPYKHGGDL